MMFEIDENDLPIVRTHAALLVIDLQNDFDPTSGLLPVKNPPGYIDNIINLLPQFRATGHVVWVRSVFETSRPVNSPVEESEAVVTNKSLLLGRRPGTSRSKGRRYPPGVVSGANVSNGAHGRGTADDLLSDDDDEYNGISETFFTIEPGQKPRLVLQATPGTNLCYAARAGGIDGDKDLIIQKSYYSAFKDGSLVQILRSKFVTELYLCGALTNISVFATAMDAARHGYAITILDDCLGYRSKRRHDVALKEMTDFTGCDTMRSTDLIKDLKQRANTRSPTSRGHTTHPNMNIEMLLSNLKITSGCSSAPAPKSQVAVAGAERSASSESVTGEEQRQPPPQHSDLDGKKPERVRSRVKARRRPSKQVLKEPKDAVEPTDRAETKSTATAESTLSQPLPEAVEESVPETVNDSKVVSHPPKDALATIEGADPLQKTESAVMEPNAVIDTPRLNGESEIDPEIKNGGSTSTKEPIPICEGDTIIIDNLLSDELSEEVFARIRDEVRWQKMSHQGGDVPRLICVQGKVGEDGSKPIYRHPADESPPLLPFSPSVSLIKAAVEAKLGHPVNHVLIQFYRDGKDYISEHSDKTLDIVPDTFIANASLGAQRTMVFRTKKPLKNAETTEIEDVQPRQSCRAPLLHNSLCKMGLVTNMRWLHAIRQDKRMASEKSPAELAYDGGRISLTFRQIGTFLDKDEVKIWGQGAIGKTKNEARTVVNGETPDAEQMIRAFGKENHSSDFNWNETYGVGFDVLHIANSPKLFLSGDSVSDLRVKLMLAKYNILWTEGTLSSSFNWKDGSSATNAPPIPFNLPVKFIDNDIHKSTTTGDLAIMLYLDTVYGASSRTAPHSQAFLACQFTCFQECNELLKRWRVVPFNVKPFRRELEIWEARVKDSDFVAGDSISLADFAFWPIVHDVAKEWGDCASAENLGLYYIRLLKREVFANAVGFDEGTGEGAAFDIKEGKH